MTSQVLRWVLGLIYIVAVACIWIAASFVVQSVVDAGVSPFLITYICNSLFVVYIPMVEIGRFLEDKYEGFWFWKKKTSSISQDLGESEQVVLLEESDLDAKASGSTPSVLVEEGEISEHGEGIDSIRPLPDQDKTNDNSNKQVDAKGRWTRTRVAKVSLLICPFWFLAQLTFNLSLKYTTVTVTIFEVYVAYVISNLFCPHVSPSNWFLSLLLAVKYHLKQCIQSFYVFGLSSILGREFYLVEAR
jgi:solute carrier family 35 protein F5